MKILSVCQDAAVVLNRPKPSGLFSTTDPFAAELLLAAQETAESLVKEEHDWRDLTLMATCQGDASTVIFPLATVAPGYERLIKGAKLHSLRFKNATFRAAKDLDEFLFFEDNLLVGSPGNWVLLNKSVQIFPPMPVSDTARFFYITNQYAASAAGTPQTAFLADTDTFVLDERLLRLGIVWRWSANKRLEYAEDLKDYEIAKAAAMGKDKGSQVITVGSQRVSRSNNVGIAYPGMLGPKPSRNSQPLIPASRNYPRISCSFSIPDALMISPKPTAWRNGSHRQLRSLSTVHGNAPLFVDILFTNCGVS
jgi:hypothetical protein